MKKSRLIVILTIIFTILAVLPLGLFVFGLKAFFNTVEKVAPPNTIEQQENNMKTAFVSADRRKNERAMEKH